MKSQHLKVTTKNRSLLADPTMNPFFFEDEDVEIQMPEKATDACLLEGKAHNNPDGKRSDDKEEELQNRTKCFESGFSETSTISTLQDVERWNPDFNLSLVPFAMQHIRFASTSVKIAVGLAL